MNNMVASGHFETGLQSMISSIYNTVRDCYLVEGVHTVSIM